MLGKIISPEQSKTKVNKVVVVVVRILQECHRRCRRRHRRRRRRRRHCRQSFLCLIWRLSIRLRPDKIKSRRNLPKQQMKRHLLWACNLLR